MTSAFERAFGNPVAEARRAIAEGRHAILGGWFGQNFEPHPMRQRGPDRAEPNPGERDIHGNERGIDR